MDNWTLILALLISLCASFYWYLSRKYSFWSNRGVVGPKPRLFGGNIPERVYKSPTDIELEWAQKYGKIYGSYVGTDPVLSVSDVKVIKQILVKDFHLFANRRQFNVYHELMTDNLFQMEAERWKRVRTITSPTFTTGKLRGMRRLMNKCVDRIDAYFGKICQNRPGVIKTKEVIAGFTIDVIASTTFATETNANDDREKSSPFVNHATNFFNFNKLKILCAFTFPRFINDLLGIRYLTNQESSEFFMDLTKQIVKQRKLDTAKRNDLVQLLLDARVDKNELANTSYDKLTVSMDNAEETTSNENKQSSSGSTQIKLTENEIIAQCILFFVGGFETTASTISHLIYEMSQNPAIQHRLCDELNQALAGMDQNSEAYYEKLMNQIPFLDAVIKETLRKYPPLIRLERRVGIDGYKIGNIELKRDTLVEIPIYSVHRDPDYHPDPETFNPERFMPENKHLLIPYSYLPFGDGPRNCIGMRFAYQEIKLFLAQIVPKYCFSTTPDTPVQLQFKAGSILLNVKPFPISVSKR